MAPKHYPPEFRERAVRHAQESGRPLGHVARDLGVDRQTLRNWMRKFEKAGRGGDKLTMSERERLKALERENGELRRANEILKAATSFFAKELDQTPPKR